MTQFHLLALGAVLAMSTSLALAQGSSAPVPPKASPSQMACEKAAKQRHDHAERLQCDDPHRRAGRCAAVASQPLKAVA